ncbi:lipopolysaccharide biosynthesis protein [Lacticaseibacillus camelliae]|uniref:Transporter n=1 Tax=Lacticaseibacillus camelliae DSM 22697 = JCM 13995 TaxID=1423730 RepID=A0A0R2FA21_9LACO|nr:oligosaccharide flippase family protein [Lacticaseibacillus camelliae]KRN21636.1 transporter [Lacticaseibacillus camelliae DSM 22697 = JCM 13995]
MKKQRGRLEYSIMNSGISTGIYIMRLLIQFIARSIFIRFLGETYLGLNGLFTNILSLLSVSELGVGSSIIFSLYKPIALHDHPQIVALMQLYRKAYNWIGVTIGVLGIAVMPFLHLMIHGSQHVDNLYLIYLLFLTNSVVSYFFTYKRSLISADQKAYIVTLNDFLFLLVANIVQITFLYIHADFVIYLIIQIIFTIAGNVCISWIVDRRYPYIQHAKAVKVDKATSDEIKKNVLGNMSSTIGGQIVMGTDNIFISSFVSLIAVGIYSNYTLIVNAVQNICKQITNSITASIGNFAVEADASRRNDLFRRHFFVSQSLAFFTGIELLVLLDPFISWWVGKGNVLPKVTALLIVINYVIQVYRNTGFVFIQSFGLFWYQRIKPVIEATINVALSLLFLIPLKMGINGVLLATIGSSFGFVIWYEGYVVYHYALQRPVREYVVLIFRGIAQLFVAGAIVDILVNRFITLQGGLLSIIIKAFVTLILSMILYILFSFKTPEFKYVLSVGKRFLKR